MIRFISAFLLLSMLCNVHAEEPVSESQNEPISDENSLKQESLEKKNLEIFKKLFVRRRKEHMEAIKGLLKMESYERRYKMVSVLTEKIYNVLETKKAILEKVGFIPNNISFPEDTEVKDALSSILENTALFGDIVLHLPDIMQRLLKHQLTWHSIMKQSFSFVSQMRHLLDKPTFTMLHLAEQELQFIPREPNYVNPYWTKPDEQLSSGKKTKSKKEKRKKEPRITRVDL